MSHLTLAFLAGFEALLDGEPLAAFGTDKVRGLLAYLAVESARPHRRAALASMFWPELPEKKAAHNLSQSLLRLRHVLGEDRGSKGPAVASRSSAPPRQPFLLVSSRDVQFNPLSDHQLDVARFAEVLRISRQHVHAQAETCRDCLGWLGQASDLYAGDFLAGFSLRGSVAFEEWQLVRQEALHIQVIETLIRLVAYHERLGEPEQVQRYARRLVALEPWHEPTQIKLMTALAQSGQVSAALEQYVAYSQMLAREFGMTPSAEAMALAEQIRARRLGDQDDERAGRRRAAGIAARSDAAPAGSRRSQASGARSQRWSAAGAIPHDPAILKTRPRRWLAAADSALPCSNATEVIGSSGREPNV